MSESVKDNRHYTGKVLGIIDLGSNSARLMLVRVHPDASSTVLNQVKHMVRLGEGGFAENRLQEAAMQRAIEVLEGFAKMCAAYGAQEVLAITTAAVRDASNGMEFINRAHARTGIHLTVISGMEEARLIYLGVSGGLAYSPKPRLFVDIGGGSTELIAGDSTTHYSLDSLKVGCVRLTNLFFGDDAGPIPPQRYATVREYIRNEAVHAFQRLRPFAVTEAVGSSGTIQSLFEIASMMENGETRQPSRAPNNADRVLSFAGLCAAAEKLCAMTLDERKAIPGINPGRAQVIVAGAAILQTIMEEQKLDHIVASSRNLQHGILADYLMRAFPERLHGSPSVREQSVLGLARKCRFEERHALHVATLALELFDSARTLNLHKADDAARSLLRYAALLHDIGIFIAFTDHHAHSRYLIHNTELLGFTARDIDIMAHTAYAHRKRPSKKDPSLAGLDDDAAELVRLLCVFLILAERLDRSHCGLVRAARFVGYGTKLVLELDAAAHCPIELLAVDRARKQLEKCFGKSISVRVLGQDA